MNGTTEAPAVRGAGSRWRRWRWPALAALALVAVGVLVAVALRGGDDDADSARTTPATTPPAATQQTEPPAQESPDAVGTPSPSPGTAPEESPGATPLGNEPPPSLPQVGLGETAAVGDGVDVAIAAVESIQGQASGRGDIAGPALRVTVRITNGTGAEVALDGVTVNLAFGDAVTPAPPLDDPSRAPFGGTVASGATAEGIYVFSVASGSADPVVVEVGYRPGAPVVLFVGPVR